MKRVILLAMFLLLAAGVVSIRPAEGRTSVSGMPASPGLLTQQPESPALDDVTYYLLDREELASLLDTQANTNANERYTTVRVAPQSVIAVVNSDLQEAELRRTIAAANQQTAAYDEPGFRIVNLRVQAPVAP